MAALIGTGLVFTGDSGGGSIFGWGVIGWA